MDEQTQSITTQALRRLTAATITQALADAEGGDVGAIAWLASRSAEPWFDFLDLPQSRVLMRSDWREWAHEELCLEPEPHTTYPYTVILTTLEYLDELESRSTR